VREDVRPRLFAQHEEHQYVQQAQQINVDPAHTIMSLGVLKNGFKEAHGNVLAMLVACEFYAQYTVCEIERFHERENRAAFGSPG
jgi:hypothetical protein